MVGKIQTPMSQPLQEEALSEVSGAEILTGNDGVQKWGGSDGNDIIDVRGCNDFLSLGGGNDAGYGGAGNDMMSGDSGDDLLRGGTGHDWLQGKADHAQLYADEGNDTLDGGKGEDFAQGGAGDDTYRWHPIHDGNDTFYGAAGSNTILLTHPGAFEQFGSALEIRIDQGMDGRWENGALVFDHPVSGTLTFNGTTLTFTGVQRIADL